MKNLVLAAAAVLTATSVSAIVVQDYPTAESPPAGLDWSCVHNYKGSSAVAVGGSWLLTAGHVADDGGSGSLSIDGYTYTPVETVYHPSADLALIRFDYQFPCFYTLYTGNLTGIEVLLAGFGDTGTVSTHYWTMSGNGKGTKRWGSQQIDRTRSIYYHAGGSVGFTQNYGFWMDFDLGYTTHEAGTATGDSGSGVFYNDGGEWKLAGISTSVSGSGGQYDSTFAISLPYYYNWIADTITATPTDDADGDGLTNAEENALGTDPMNADTDSDLISDSMELDKGLNPLVSNTGIDSDAEGLLDVDEVMILATNPMSPDTDQDGLTDWAEVNMHGLDPLNKDTDGDRLTDGAEVNNFGTLPDNPDTDGDNTGDGDEVLIYGTNPNDPGSDFDLDDDTIADEWEIDNFTSAANCHPTNDPDGDYYPNLDEFRNDTDPNVFDTYITLWAALKLEWNAVSGTLYQVQMSTNLLSGEWVDLGDPVIGAQATQYVMHSTRGNEGCYYRVIDAALAVRPATELEWIAAPEVVYQVQMSTNGTGGIWYELGGQIEGNGQTQYTFESTAPAANKAFRVQRIGPLGQ